MSLQENQETLLKALLKLATICGLIVIPALTFYYGDRVKGSYQKDIVNFLLTVSAIIFGVMGAWLSIIKVEIQNGLKNAASNEQAEEYMTRARGLIEPISISSIVLMGTIVFTFAYHIFLSIGVSASVIPWLKSISFSLIGLGAYGLIYSIGIVIYQGAAFLVQLSIENQSQRANRQKKAHSQKAP